MSAPKLHSADLIISDTEGGAGDKGKEAIAARLDMLGVTLNSVQMVPHDAESIAAAITTSQADLVMILSGSATSDWADVAPTAVSQAVETCIGLACLWTPGIYCSLAASDQTRNRFARMRAFACIERGRLGFIACGVWFGCHGCGFCADGHWRIAKGNSNAATTTPSKIPHKNKTRP